MICYWYTASQVNRDQFGPTTRIKCQRTWDVLWGCVTHRVMTLCVCVALVTLRVLYFLSVLRPMACFYSRIKNKKGSTNSLVVQWACWPKAPLTLLPEAISKTLIAPVLCGNHQTAAGFSDTVMKHLHIVYCKCCICTDVSLHGTQVCVQTSTVSVSRSRENKLRWRWHLSISKAQDFNKGFTESSFTPLTFSLLWRLDWEHLFGFSFSPQAPQILFATFFLVSFEERFQTHFTFSLTTVLKLKPQSCLVQFQSESKSQRGEATSFSARSTDSSQNLE